MPRCANFTCCLVPGRLLNRQQTLKQGNANSTNRTDMQRRDCIHGPFPNRGVASAQTNLHVDLALQHHPQCAPKLAASNLSKRLPCPSETSKDVRRSSRSCHRKRTFACRCQKWFMTLLLETGRNFKSNFSPSGSDFREGNRRAANSFSKKLLLFS